MLNFGKWTSLILSVVFNIYLACGTEVLTNHRKKENKEPYCDPVTIKLRFSLTVTEINYNYRLNLKNRIVMRIWVITLIKCGF
jgi:hypothetical protein